MIWIYNQYHVNHLFVLAISILPVLPYYLICGYNLSLIVWKTECHDEQTRKVCFLKRKKRKDVSKVLVNTSAQVPYRFHDSIITISTVLFFMEHKWTSTYIWNRKITIFGKRFRNLSAVKTWKSAQICSVQILPGRRIISG